MLSSKQKQAGKFPPESVTSNSMIYANLHDLLRCHQNNKEVEL